MDNKPLLNLTQHKAGKVMGWVFRQNETKQQLIERLTADYTNNETGNNSKCVKHSLRGSHLWAIVDDCDGKTGLTTRYIALFLLSSERGFGYGCKDLSESCHPYYYDCPLSFLKLCPRVACEEWRQGVIEYHAKQNKKITFKVNDVLINEKSSVKRVELIEQKTKASFIGRDVYGKRWKITRAWLKDAELQQTAQ